MGRQQRTLESVEGMTEALTQTKEKSGYSQKLYKAQSDSLKTEQLQADIRQRIAAMQETDKRERIDWNDLAMVQDRTYKYLRACEASGTFPSVTTLATHGFGVSRQALYAILRTRHTEVTDFIERIMDELSDILTNASLFGSANPVQTIFQLKNLHGYSDKLEIQPLAPIEEERVFNEEELRKRYLIDDSDSTADDE